MWHKFEGWESLDDNKVEIEQCRELIDRLRFKIVGVKVENDPKQRAIYFVDNSESFIENGFTAYRMGATSPVPDRYPSRVALDYHWEDLGEMMVAVYEYFEPEMYLVYDGRLRTSKVFDNYFHELDAVLDGLDVQLDDIGSNMLFKVLIYEGDNPTPPIKKFKELILERARGRITFLEEDTGRRTAEQTRKDATQKAGQRGSTQTLLEKQAAEASARDLYQRIKDTEI